MRYKFVKDHALGKNSHIMVLKGE